jgi:hypothetical protein
MTFTTRIQNIFKKNPKPIRKTGYYWVQYSYGGARKWRVAWYSESLEYWQLEGDRRVFYDNDFIKIYKRSIPDRTLIRLDKFGCTLFIIWMVLTLGYLIYQIILAIK